MSMTVEYQLMKQLDLEDEIDNHSSNDTEKLVINFLNKLQECPIVIEDNFKDLEWINVSESLSLSKNFNGLITVCDFFTYCCINCLHILPFLHRIESKYIEKEVLFLGIHSPKFENEKSSKNVMNAVIRHDITHPVCNDPELKLWNQLCIRCWPTIIIISPNGELLFTLMGELAIQNKLEFYIDICLKYYGQKNQLFIERKFSLPIINSQDQRSAESSRLNYPTKIAASIDGKRLAIANTLSNTIIVTTVDGIIEFIIGSSSVGFQDGSFEHASFNHPQGIAWINQNEFYVCDTENSAIRKIDLILQTVETVTKSLNSPWDLVFNPDDNRLYIAVAGSHQIWTLILSKQGDIVHGNNVQYLSCICFAGDGNEQKRNHRNLLKSSFAQPSGIAVNSNVLYIADSESSSIRMINLQSNSVSTLVGGSIDPTDLFAFGDIDDIGSKCRLQHCMGICYASNDIVYIADTYNHKVKQIEIESKKCQNLTVNWTEHNDDDEKFNEPNGLCFLYDQNVLLVADTNNHRIVSIDLNNNFNATIFSIIDSIDDQSTTDEAKSNLNNNLSSNVKTIMEKPLKISYNQKMKILLRFDFIDTLKADTNAKHLIKCKLLKNSSVGLSIISDNNIRTNNLNNIEFILQCTTMTTGDYHSELLSIECNLNLCHLKENFCTLQKILIKQPIIISKDDVDDNEKIIFINL
ncbi:NHL repeat-containing protein 2 [Dermatophagoides pteronyssinus]|uniref:NHL repeat-containing protein 2 n=1 Tax=Dermatophagoides pteronyssinus TaxID=6956 RepID=UPI003F679BFC